MSPYKVYCLLSNGPQFAHVGIDMSKLSTSTTMLPRLESSNIPHTEHIALVAARQASDRQQSGDIIPHAVIHSLAVLRMEIELPETCWAYVKVNKCLLLHLFGLYCIYRTDILSLFGRGRMKPLIW